MKDLGSGDDRFKYFKKISEIKEKMFDCPCLAVLPEDAKFGVIQYELDPTTEEWIKWYEFPKGSWFCTGLQDFCCISTKMIVPDENGNIVEANCAWNSSRFKIKIVGFEPKGG